MAEARRPGRNFLFVPGPTNVPDRILRAMHVAMEDHRSSDFPKLTKPLYDGLKQVFKTEGGDVVILPSSGTGAWECALTTLMVMGGAITAEKVKHGPPDLTVRPKVDAFRTLDVLQARAILRASEPVKAELKEMLAALLG